MHDFTISELEAVAHLARKHGRVLDDSNSSDLAGWTSECYFKLADKAARLLAELEEGRQANMSINATEDHLVTMYFSQYCELTSAGKDNERLTARVAELEKEVRSWKFNRDTWKDSSEREAKWRKEAEQKLARDETERNRDALRRVHGHLEARYSSELYEPSKYRREGALKLLSYCKDLIKNFEGE